MEFNSEITWGFVLAFIIQIVAFIKMLVTLFSRVDNLEKQIVEIKDLIKTQSLQNERVSNTLNETVKTLAICQAISKQKEK